MSAVRLARAPLLPRHRRPGLHPDRLDGLEHLTLQGKGQRPLPSPLPPAAREEPTGPLHLPGLSAMPEVEVRPLTKSPSDFDWSCQPSIDQKELKELAKLPPVHQGENVIFLGTPGVGNAHRAVVLGLKAVEAGYRMLCSTATYLVTTLAKALTEPRFEERLHCCVSQNC